MKDIATFLEANRWRCHRDHGETYYASPDEEHVVVLGKWWELRHFTDSDMDTDSGPRAVGRYVLDEEGETLLELRDALRIAMRGAAA